MVKKIIIDCDAEMDDARLAHIITFGQQSSKGGVVNLLAVTTVFGNTTMYVKKICI